MHLKKARSKYMPTDMIKKSKKDVFILVNMIQDRYNERYSEAYSKAYEKGYEKEYKR